MTNHYSVQHIKRYDLHSDNMVLRINDNIYDCVFCTNCGNYLSSETNKNNRNIMCLCDRIPILYDSHRRFLEEIPEYTSGDELEDYIENSESSNKGFMKTIYNTVLFGMTFEKNYYNNMDNYIIENILDYTI